MAESGRGSLPQVAYNAAQDEYLVAWYGFKSGEDGEAWGQRINAATGAAIGGDVPLTAHGTATDEDEGSFPSISYNPLAGNYLMTYTHDLPDPGRPRGLLAGAQRDRRAAGNAGPAVARGHAGL